MIVAKTAGCLFFVAADFLIRKGLGKHTGYAKLELSQFCID
jgi:hypothetical protein